MEPAQVKRRLTCILAADAVGYSSHMSADEEGTVRVLAAHRAVIDGIIAYHDGRIVGTAGDSVLAEFASAVSAVRCASEIQEAIKTRNDALPASQRLLFRVGVNLGDVVVKDQDLLGDGVNIASRLETLAEPGGICISSSVYEQITGKLNLGFLDIGEQNLKNIGRPVRVYRVAGTQAVAVQTERAPRGLNPLMLTVLCSVAAVGVAGVLAWSQGWLRFAPLAEPVAQTVPPAATPAQTPPAALPAPEVLALPPAASPAAATPAPGKTPAQVPAGKAPVSAASPPKATTHVAPAVSAAATVPVDRTPAAGAPERPQPPPAVSAPPERPQAIAVPEPPASADRFDGTWMVRVRCDGGPGGAEPYELAVVATVRQGWLRAERQVETDASTLILEGQIGADGRALLKARGQTGDPRFSMNRVRPGSQYGYEVDARFEGDSGQGVRTGRRRCDLRFQRQ
jgi:class 3 adenylate cyclase